MTHALLPPSYSCPECGTRAAAGGGCPRCGAAMRALATLPRARRQPTERRYDIHRAFLAGGALSALAVFPLATAAALWCLPAIVAGYPVLLACFVAFSLGGKASELRARRRMARAVMGEAAAQLAAGPPAAIRDASEGVAHVAGTVVPRVLVTAPSGVPCVAFAQAGAEFDGEWRIRGGGGAFELDDGSGVRAIVHAQDVIVLGSKSGVVEPGARVEVVGPARWIAADRAARGPMGSLRDAAHMLEIVGSSQQPVVLRVVGGGAELPAPWRD